MNDILISVVVPVYNTYDYLHVCLNSLVNQTIMPYEIILVDDGSTDGSSKVCDDYSCNYRMIKVIHKTNEGLGFARNTGMEYASGNYITFVDSDDYVDKNYIETFINIILETSCDTCKTSYKRVNLLGEFLSDNPVEAGEYVNEEVKNILLPRIIGSPPEKHDAIPLSACATAFSMDIIRKNALAFPSEREWISEDTLFNIYYYSLAKHVILSSEITYNYRRNTNSLTTKYEPRRLERCIKMYYKEIEVLKEHELYDLCRYRLMKQFFNYLRMCIEQLNKKRCGIEAREIKKQILKICQNQDVNKVINAYPIEKLGFASKTFIWLIKGKHIHLLYFIYNCKIFEGRRA